MENPKEAGRFIKSEAAFAAEFGGL